MMKRKILFGLTILSTCILSNSCSYTIYSESSLSEIYDAKMVSPDQQLIKEDIKIYKSEREIPGDFTVVGYLEYKPVTIPLIAPLRKQQTNKFYMKAVSKTYDLGADAILITSVGYAKMINVGGSNRLDIVTPFEDGSIDTFTSSKKAAYVERFTTEIINKIAASQNEADLIEATRYVDLYDKYFSAYPKLYKAASARVHAFRQDIKYRRAVIKNDGDMSNLTTAQRKAYTTKMAATLKTGIKEIDSLDDVAYMRQMLDVYTNCFEGRKAPQKAIEEFTDDINSAEKKITKKMARATEKSKQ